MQVWPGISEVDRALRGSVVTVGNFDGVHIGHRRLFTQVIERAKALGTPAVAVTFDPHPVHLLAPSRELKLLTPMPERLALMDDAGLDAVLVLHFDEALAAQSARDFARTILIEALKTREVIVGEGFHFGHRAQGNIDLLRTLGLTVTAEAPVQRRGSVVSSTRIRTLLSRGQVSAASRLLGRPYSVAGPVVKGRGIGKSETVPTLNLAPYAELLPMRGVYITETACGDFRGPSVTNIGRNPTFGGTELHLESHFLDAPRGTASAETKVHFLFRIRDEIKFPSVDALRARIGRDIALAREYFRRTGR